LAGQIEHWARMGECAEENPDLPYTLNEAPRRKQRGIFTGAKLLSPQAAGNLPVEIKEILMGLDELDENEKTQALERKRRGT
jgi:hypothetical protein